MGVRNISGDVLVIGAGPAGLMAAISAAQSGRQVVLAEYLPSPGRKLLASGAGKCNVTNVLDPEAFGARFHCNARFLRPALRGFPPEALRMFLRERGCPTVVTDGFHVFPKSMRSRDVLDALLDFARILGVRIECSCPVGELLLEAGGVKGAAAPGIRFAASRVVLAAGGMGYPALGGRGSGYELARQAGHAVATPVPALVGLRSAESWPAELAGTILPKAAVRLEKETAPPAELIFTHSGVSGPAVLDLSGSVARRLPGSPEVTLRCSWLDRSAEEWRALLELWRRESGRKQLSTLLALEFSTAFARQLIALAGIPPECRAALLGAAQRDRLIGCLADYPLRINGTDGWEKAMATAGGVALSEVAAGTLESRKLAGLFFAGEMLDVGAPCGGYNIQWALSSGRLAGASAGNRVISLEG